MSEREPSQVPVQFKVPKNWHSMPRHEQDVLLDEYLDRLGVPGEHEDSTAAVETEPDR